MLNNNSKTVIKQLLKQFYGKLNKNKIVNGTVEVIGKSLILSPTGGRLEYGDLRKFPLKYHEDELAWYLSKDLCIKGHKGIEDNKIWSSICTDGGMVNSNYGYLVFEGRDKTAKKSQYDYALENLNLTDEYNSGRQSVIYYSGPEMQIWNSDGIHAKHDWTCTFCTQHFIREGKLVYIVNQRSCDLLYGLTFDFEWHKYVYSQMVKDLRKRGIGIKIGGKIQFNFGSVHVYSRHFDLVKKIVEAYDGGELE